MKRLLLVALLSTILIADEIERIESIVNDITNLRIEYKKCQDELQEKQSQSVEIIKEVEVSNCTQCENRISSLIYELKDQEEKNIILQDDIEKMSFSHERELKSKDKLYKNLEKKYTLMVIQKDYQIESLKNQRGEKQPAKKDNIVVEIKEDGPNPFPKLLLKDKYREKKQISKSTPVAIDVATLKVSKVETTKPIEKTPTKVEIAKKESADKNPTNKKLKREKIVVQTTAPATYRLKKESDIYDNVDGVLVDRWEEKRSFTSNQSYKGWIKITGYFIDRKWLRAKKDLWVLEENTIKR